MLGFHFGGQKAGPLGCMAGLLIALLFFGLNWNAFWVSQVKGLLLSLYVLMVIWPALLIYNLVNQFGGIQAMAEGLQQAIVERSLLLVLTAWAFSGLLEGVAGFGLPIAIVAPILVGMGLAPLTAVAAIAVGHSWSVTFGGVGVTWQTLLAVTKMEAATIIPPTAIILGIACLGCGLGAAHVLGEMKIWPKVLAISALMGIVQYVVAVAGLPQLGAFSAGLAGLIGGYLISRNRQRLSMIKDPRFYSVLAVYGSLAGILLILNISGSIHAALDPIQWQARFPEVRTLSGFVTDAGSGQIFRPFLHPGLIMLLIFILSFRVLLGAGLCKSSDLGNIWQKTWKTAAPTTLGIIFTIGLSTLMEHVGMTQLLANGLVILTQSFYPLAAPFIGVLGAFTTGSNNNSNVLFIPLQKSIASLLGISTAWLVAAQTAGGALGSMIAPAKLIIGCSTVGLQGREGDALHKTLPYVLVIGVMLGVTVWAIIYM
ncbi:MAG: L-lactate permease, partial [Anaerolineaceae bacterium]|nr:L-lactate permease [Anaerolineaceae bacterium]